MKTNTAEAAARLARLPAERRPPLHSHQYELKVHCDRNGRFLHHRSTPWEGPTEPKWLRDLQPADDNDEISTRSTQHPWHPTRREDHTDHYSYMLSKTGGAAAAASQTRALFDDNGRYLSTTALRTGLGATHAFDTEADTTAHLHSTYRTDFCHQGPSVATVRDVPPLTPIYRKVPAGDGTVFVDDQPYYPRLSTAFGLGYGKNHSMHRNYLHVDLADGGNALASTLAAATNGTTTRTLAHHNSAPSASPSVSSSTHQQRGHSADSSRRTLSSAGAATLRNSVVSPMTVPPPDPNLPARPKRGIPATSRRTS